MRMLPGSGKVTFCKLTGLEKRGSVSGGGDDVDDGDGERRGILDHRMWIVVILLIHKRDGEETREQTFIARLKNLNGRTMFCDTVQ